jgi:hypothetical protein
MQRAESGWYEPTHLVRETQCRGLWWTRKPDAPRWWERAWIAIGRWLEAAGS